MATNPLDRRSLVRKAVVGVALVWTTPMIVADTAHATAFGGTPKCEPKVGSGLPNVVLTWVKHDSTNVCGLKVEITNPTNCPCSASTKKVCVRISVDSDNKIYDATGSTGAGLSTVGYLNGAINYTKYVWRTPSDGTNPRAVNGDGTISVCVIAKCIRGSGTAFGAERYEFSIPSVPSGSSCSGNAGDADLNYPTDCAIPSYSSGASLPSPFTAPTGCTLA